MPSPDLLAYVPFLFLVSDDDRGQIGSGGGELRRARGRPATAAAVRAHARLRVDDGWDLPEDLPPLQTEVAIERAQHRQPQQVADIPFDRSISPIEGAGTAASTVSPGRRMPYLASRPGLDFRTRLTAKPGAATALRAELSRRSRLRADRDGDQYRSPTSRSKRFESPGPSWTCCGCSGIRDDPDQGALIGRCDILGEMGRDGLAAADDADQLDPKLARAMGPRAAALGWSAADDAAAGRGRVPGLGLDHGPVIPGLSDAEIEHWSRRRRQGRWRAGAMWCCACRWRSGRCSATGWRKAFS